MSLDLLQRNFCDFLGDKPNGAANLVDVTTQRGLAVYRYAYEATLIHCLKDTYEKTAAWIGDEDFETVARTYIAQTPSQSWTLADYGEQFGKMLAARYQDDPEIEELAWLDWSLRRAFDAADAPPLDMAELANVDWDGVRLVFGPSFAVRLVSTNCAAIWTALTEDRPDPPMAEALPEPLALLVWRQELSPRYETASGDEFRALTLARSGLSFGALCEAYLEQGGAGADVSQIGDMLGRWLRDGLVVGVRPVA